MALFRPTGTLHCLTEITPELLCALRVRAIVLDADNTMSAHGAQTPFPGVLEWTQAMTAAGYHLVVVSNNYKKRVAPFAAQFGLPYTSFACKPSPFGYLRAKKSAGVRVREQRIPVTIIEDGFFSQDNLKKAGKDEKWLNSLLKKRKTNIRDTFLLTVDTSGQVNWIGKGRKV